MRNSQTTQNHFDLIKTRFYNYASTFIQRYYFYMKKILTIALAEVYLNYDAWSSMLFGRSIRDKIRIETLANVPACCKQYHITDTSRLFPMLTRLILMLCLNYIRTRKIAGFIFITESVYQLIFCRKLYT